jgi:hypothetical protein
MSPLAFRSICSFYTLLDKTGDFAGAEFLRVNITVRIEHPRNLTIARLNIHNTIMFFIHDNFSDRMKFNATPALPLGVRPVKCIWMAA